MFKGKSRKSLVLIAILVFSMLLNACGKESGEVVAKVNGEGILAKDYATEYEVFRSLYSSRYGEEALEQAGPNGTTLDEQVREDALNKLIMEELINKEIKDSKLEVNDKEFKDYLNTMIESLGGNEQYEAALKESGVSKEYFEKNSKQEYSMIRYQEYFLENLDIDEEEAKKYFEENKDDLVQIKASHILVNSEEEGNKILEQLKSGEEFATIAVEESLDSQSGQKGGDLGYFSRGTWIEEFEDAAFELKVGETSGLVKTDVGYHIIKLEDKKESFDELKDDIVKTLKEEAYRDHIAKLEEDAEIEKFDEIIEKTCEAVLNKLNKEKETEDAKEADEVEETEDVDEADEVDETEDAEEAGEVDETEDAEEADEVDETQEDKKEN